MNLRILIILVSFFMGPWALSSIAKTDFNKTEEVASCSVENVLLLTNGLRVSRFANGADCRLALQNLRQYDLFCDENSYLRNKQGLLLAKFKFNSGCRVWIELLQAKCYICSPDHHLVNKLGGIINSYNYRSDCLSDLAQL
ncbi:MAG: hypothetical protein HRT44_08805 [Bdellovibrionales bacterium]|nr:hypothetical protein [Bdellovibrionales bacterium]